MTVDSRQASQLRTGMVLIAIGLLFLGGEVNFWDGMQLWRFWPFVAIALGIGFVVFPGKDGSRSGGFWLIFVGSVFLLHTYRVMSIRDSWPLFIVAAGVSVLAGGLRRPAPRQEP